MKLHYLSTLAAAAGLVTFTACDKAKENVVKAEEKVKEMAEKATDKTKDLAEKATDKAKVALDKTKELATAAVDKAKEVAATVKEKVEEKLHAGDYPAAAKAAFVAALEPIKKLHEEVKTAGANGQPPVEKLGEMVAALKALPTEGMPADFKDALTAANDKFEEFVGTIKQGMADPAAVTPEAFQKLEEESKTLGDKAIETGTKYGVDLSFME